MCAVRLGCGRMGGRMGGRMSGRMGGRMSGMMGLGAAGLGLTLCLFGACTWWSSAGWIPYTSLVGRSAKGHRRLSCQSS